MLGHAEENERIRDAVLGCASDFRTCAERLEADPADEQGLATITEVQRAFVDTAGRVQMPLLVQCGGALARLTALGTTLSRAGDAAARDIFGAAVDAIGVVEQCLDDALEAGFEDRLDSVTDRLRAVLPFDWRDCLDLDAPAFEKALAHLPSPPELANCVRTHETSEAEGPVGAPDAAEEDPERAFQRELVEAFNEESADRFAQCETLLLQLEREPQNREVIDALFRQYHTLKGAAAAVDLSAAAAQLHEGESLLQAVRDEGIEIDATVLVGFLLRLTDSVKGLIDHARGCARSPYHVITDLDAELTRVWRGETPAASAPPAAERETVEDGAPSVGGRTLVDEHLPALAELRKQLRSGALGDHMRQFIEALDQQARQFSQMAAGLQAEVLSMRTVPLDGVLQRLQRPVRDAARAEGKTVELIVTGGDVRVEREVAERLAGALLHMVRNAVAHGIETPAVRAARGKAPAGTVRVHAERRGQTLVVTVEDDGAGLDFDAIRAKAVKRGWLGADDLASRADLARLIFRPGFSTRDDVSTVAGRGVGMDAVAREIEALNGRVDVESLAGRGTSVYLTIPIRRATASHGVAA